MHVLGTVVTALFVVLIATSLPPGAERGAMAIGSNGAAAATGLTTTGDSTTGPEPTSTTVLDNDFIPEERNLTDCIGVLQRPGCGSEARGGWRQGLVFVAVIGGLAIVFWRVRAGVMRNRAALGATPNDRPKPT